MFALVLVAYSVNAMDRMVFPILLPDVRKEYGFGLGAAGLQSTIFALGMALTGIPAGLLLRKASRRFVIVTGTVLFSAATILTCVSAGFWDMLLWRVLSGVGEALQLAAIITVAAHAFPRHRGLAIGSVNMAFAAGSVIGPSLGVALRGSHDSWRAPMVVFGLIGVVAALLVATAVRRSLTEALLTGASVHHEGGATSLRSWNPLLLAAITVLFGLVDFAYIGMYPSYLREALGFTGAQAGLAVSLSGFAAFASPAGGWLVDRLRPRLAIALLSGLDALAGAALFLGPHSVAWQAAWSLLFGLFASSGLYVGLAAGLVKSMHEDHASRASGLFITCIYLAAAFAGFLFSSLVQAVGWSSAGVIQITGLSVVGVLVAGLLKGGLFSRINAQVPTKE